MGAVGTVLYIFPFAFVLPLAKELSRLEINLRGFEDEKKKPEYYDFF